VKFVLPYALPDLLSAIGYAQYGVRNMRHNLRCWHTEVTNPHILTHLISTEWRKQIERPVLRKTYCVGVDSTFYAVRISVCLLAP